ncbi:hypothetical protein AM1_2851 [Acaryochloris marina MBIC11017]|uniref:Uncharacterized protein n=1 Tax=Acaryochloris marina (strain MBIC 11017) TaxID=329726 RepID=B0CAB6_ACAM1|nr:hypothetical protein AM1_2851 [Acaryochloris marina MBIC11017]
MLVKASGDYDSYSLAFCQTEAFHLHHPGVSDGEARSAVPRF